MFPAAGFISSREIRQKAPNPPRVSSPSYGLNVSCACDAVEFVPFFAYDDGVF